VTHRTFVEEGYPRAPTGELQREMGAHHAGTDDEHIGRVGRHALILAQCALS
jgi:hypothetical protein